MEMNFLVSLCGRIFNLELIIIVLFVCMLVVIFSIGDKVERIEKKIDKIAGKDVVDDPNFGKGRLLRK